MPLLFLVLLSIPTHAAESFKLYKSPHPSVDPTCDAHTVLSFDPTASRADLQDALLGSCDLHVAPSQRSYRVVWSYVGSCDETVYITSPDGTAVSSDTKDAAIITDYRTDTCSPPPPARIMIEETRDGQLGLLYSEN